MTETVVDASAMVDFLLNTPVADHVDDRLRNHIVHAPAHFDAEVLSALARLQRAGQLTPDDVERLIGFVAKSPIERHPLPKLLPGAWQRRSNASTMDALYLELAEQLDVEIITTDSGMAATSARAILLEDS